MKGNSKKNWIIITCLVLVFSFFFGFYLNYRISENEKSKLDIIKEIMEEEWYYGIEEEDLSMSLENKMIQNNVQGFEYEVIKACGVSLPSEATITLNLKSTFFEKVKSFFGKLFT